MSDLSLLRVIINDQKQYSVARSAGDGQVNEFFFPHSPIYPSSLRVYVNASIQSAPTDYTADLDKGLITFTTGHIPPASSLVQIAGEYTLLSDTPLQQLMDMYSDDVKLAAADALDIIASSEALITKRIKTLDLSLDGPAVASSLREHAKNLRAQVLGVNGEEPSFDFAEQINDTSGYVEKTVKDTLRSNP